MLELEKGRWHGMVSVGLWFILHVTQVSGNQPHGNWLLALPPVFAFWSAPVKHRCPSSS